MHCDLKPNNTMGNYVKNDIINYKLEQNNAKINFKLSNLGIDWLFIDFGFSSLSFNNNYIKSKEYSNEKQIFNNGRDFTLFFFILLKYNKFPYHIENILRQCLSNVIIDNKKYVFVPEKMNYNIEHIYDLVYVDNFKNIDCTPFNILKRIGKLVEYNF